MPTIDGVKYACVSCVRGHRVSTCYHADRELKVIPPKGRPVKQCEHCRTARKSKSHHGKCDCGSKKDKKDPDALVEIKSDCCCHVGESCRCSTRSEAVEARMERSLKRPTVPVKSKPSFTKSQSDDKLLHVGKSHPRPCHRNNNAAHTSGQPYTIPRPHSHHGQSNIDVDTKDQVFQGSDTEMSFAIPEEFAASTIPEADMDNAAEEIISYDFDKHFSSTAQASKIAAPMNAQAKDVVNYDCDWTPKQPLAITTSNLLNLTVDTSPNFSRDNVFPLFSPADLPLISPQVSNFNQTISHASDFTNESAWTADNNYIVDGQVAVGDNWPVVNATLLGDVLQSTSYGEVPAFTSTSQAAFVPASSGYENLHNHSPTKSELGNNSMIIPADPDSPRHEAVDDWWPQNSFTATNPSLGRAQSVSEQQTAQTAALSRSQSLDDSTYDVNYDWLY